MFVLYEDILFYFLDILIDLIVCCFTEAYSMSRRLLSHTQHQGYEGDAHPRRNSGKPLGTLRFIHH